MPSSLRPGWLALPAFLAVLVLVGFGVSTESADRFEARSDRVDGLDLDRLDGLTPEGSPDLPSIDGSFDDLDLEGLDLEDLDLDDLDLEGIDVDGAEITIETETGDIIIQLDEDGQPVRLTPVDLAGVDGDSIEIDPDDLVAIRLTEDGQLEVVPADQIGPDDTVVVPADGGFDLLRPDGSRVEFRADGENDGVTATEIYPDGSEIELVPNPDGSVTLSDGTTVGPIDLAEDGGVVERFIDRTRDVPWPWVFGALALLTGASIALAVYLHRNRPRDDFDLGQLASSDIPDDRFEQFLATLAADPDPSRAIRVGFSVAERGLGGLPTRRLDETPYEWHRRTEIHQPDVGPTLGLICDLFARVRFAPGRASDDERRAMIDALRTLHRRNRQGSAGDRQPVGVGV